MHPIRYFQRRNANQSGPPETGRNTPSPLSRDSWASSRPAFCLSSIRSAALADALGPKLKGSDYRIDETKTGHRMTLVYMSDWSDEDSASRFFGAYQKMLRTKWKQIEVTSQDTECFSGKSEDGYFTVVRDGAAHSRARKVLRRRRRSPAPVPRCAYVRYV